jgi:hypothetical protein
VSALSTVLNSDHYSAWVDADNPEKALRTWPRVTLQANNTAGRHGVNRRGRSASINALKRAIERMPLNDKPGHPYIRLVPESRHYSETHGFAHASYFTYRIERD